MVAVIKTGHSIIRLLNYNEQKVSAGFARLIGAGNYPVEVTDLSFSEKLNRLKNQAALNENVRRNSVHISLNFDPSEMFPEERLLEIAEVYMEKIGFADLPYLVYQHFDAGHPHIHLVSVKVRADGSRVDTQNIGRNQSEKARKEIETDFGLVRAEDSKLREVYRLRAVDVARIEYGRVESKRAMANVIGTVLQSYRYASLFELNAVLNPYNVTADRGSEGSRIFKHEGLVYRILDKKGNKVGVPVKASDFYFRPTLKFLAEKFAVNHEVRGSYKPRVKNVIDLYFLHPQNSLTELISALKKEGIDTVIRRNDDGIVYGITYVDHHTRCVFNGSSLGKAYSANAILDRCAGSTGHEGKVNVAPSEKVGLAGRDHPDSVPDERKFGAGVREFTDALLGTEEPPEQMNFELKRKKKKRQQYRPE